MKKLRSITCIALFVAVGFTFASRAQDANAAPRLRWWHQAKFGLFIHWGLYSIPGRGEWVQFNEGIPVNEYAKLANQFNPTNFTPASWAQLAKAAGAKYVVLTSRHHDGFALFDDGTNRFTSVHSAAHRDFVAEYVKAVRQAGLRVGLYYSPLDWRFPGFFFPDLYLQSAEALRAQYHRQMKELLSNYGKIDVLWFDGGETDWLSFNHDMTNSRFPERKKEQHYRGRFSWQGAEVNSMLRRLQPGIIVNNRAADVPADFTSREGWGALGDFDNRHPWELCVPMAGAWGYQPDKPPRPLKDYVQLLAKVAGRDGNLLMNVGPDRNGRVDAAQADRLGELGAWLGQYGESIYGTRGGPFLPTDELVSTHRDRTVYLHVLQWPEGKLVLPAIPARVLGASALTGGEVQFTQNDQGIELSLPVAARNDLDTIIAMQLDASADAIQPVKSTETK